MGSLLAAVAALAVAFTQSATQSAGSAGRPQTLFTTQHDRIAAFAQDGPIIAWFARAPGCPNGVHLRQLANGLEVELPSQTARNVTCRFIRTAGRPVGLAIAWATGRALWTLPQSSPLELDYLVGAGVGVHDRAERRFQELAHTARGIGQWLGGVAGDDRTLAYAATTVDYADEAGCLAGTSPCTLVKAGGGVYRVRGRASVHVPHTGPAVELAVSGSAIAYVRTGAVGRNGRPRAGAGLPIEVVDAMTGEQISSVAPKGVPLAVALSAHVLAALERTPLGLRLAWYERATGRPSGSVPVPKSTSAVLSASDRLIVFRVARSLRAVDVASHRVRILARAAATPVGLSLEGNRLAWAENLPGSSRIRALYVNGSG